jgi:GT2 family glycosyltransferase
MVTKLSIVILNWNGRDMLKRFLPTVIKYSQYEGIEIVVADNHSSDDSLFVMQEKFPGIRLIKLNHNYGFAKGYNLALKQIEAEYYLLLNSDVEVTDGWLIPLLGYMAHHPKVAACQPKLLSYKDRDSFEYAGACGGYMDKYGYMYCRGRVMDTIEKDEGQYESIESIFWATGACLMIRSADYWTAGGLDDEFFAHQEEIDLCWRLRSRNRKIVCIPESVVYHIGGATLDKSNPYKTYLNFRNNLLMLYKNLPEGELEHVMKVRYWLDMLATLVFVAQGKIGDAKAVINARKDFSKLKSKFLYKRIDNLHEATLKDIPERHKFSLIWNYHIKKKKKFSDLSELV